MSIQSESLEEFQKYFPEDIIISVKTYINSLIRLKKDNNNKKCVIFDFIYLKKNDMSILVF